jgi:D-glycero-D-manno-heptose 1,7-bisphosphate phosphatase
MIDNGRGWAGAARRARPAAFLDRDGTLIDDAYYVYGPEDVALLPGAATAVRALNDAGWLVIVVTNQSGVSRGHFSHEELRRTNERVGELLAREGARLDAVYYCPHLPWTGCVCRKPQAGMIDLACSHFAIDRAASWVIGDKGVDVELGRRAGCASALVLTGFGRWEGGFARADLVAPDLHEAVRTILRPGGLQGPGPEFSGRGHA